LTAMNVEYISSQIWTGDYKINSSAPAALITLLTLACIIGAGQTVLSGRTGKSILKMLGLGTITVESRIGGWNGTTGRSAVEASSSSPTGPSSTNA
jgi:hypothetical protein